jgi:hypothetical protein
LGRKRAGRGRRRDRGQISGRQARRRHRHHRGLGGGFGAAGLLDDHLFGHHLRADGGFAHRRLGVFDILRFVAAGLFRDMHGAAANQRGACHQTGNFGEPQTNRHNNLFPVGGRGVPSIRTKGDSALSREIVQGEQGNNREGARHVS